MSEPIAIQQVRLPGFAQDRATFSGCGTYRYTLTRHWGTGPQTVWIMLNPSTADAAADDATIRRCTAFSRSWGCGGLSVVNLYAWRATDPADLKTAGRRAVGPQNNTHIIRAAQDSAQHGWPLIAAWGTRADPTRVRDVLRLVHDAGTRLDCLGTTTAGHPRHPLYVRASTTLTPYPLPDTTTTNPTRTPLPPGERTAMHQEKRTSPDHRPSHGGGAG